MIKIIQNTQKEQARRLKIKSQEQLLVRKAVEGAGLSPWEAEELVEVVREVFFSEPQDRPLRSGQLFYECAASSEGAGKPLSQCNLDWLHSLNPMSYRHASVADSGTNVVLLPASCHYNTLSTQMLNGSSNGTHITKKQFGKIFLGE